MERRGYLGEITLRKDTLYRDGKTDYRILIPEKATEAEAFAASELTDIFHKAGVSIETVADKGLTADPDCKFIALGNTVYFRALNRKLTQKEFKFDGYIIETLGNTHIVKGVGDTGTCFGAYGFAEYAMGWRYYFEDEWKVDIAAQNRDFHMKDVPTFLGRYAYSYYTASEPDHGFRLRVNGQYFRQEPRHGEACPWSSLHDQSLPYQIMPFERYMDAHPDWYYVNQDWVENDPFYNKRPQICFSKAILSDSEGGFFDTFVKNLLEDFIIPEEKRQFFMLGISDNRAVCDCSACREAVEKYTVQGLNMRFVNKVADAVEAWRRENAPQREIYLVTFAYYPSPDPPVKWVGEEPVPVDDSVIVRDNVIVRIAPIMANYRYDLLDPVHNPNSRKALVGWNKIAKHLAVWDYRSDFGTQVFPFPTTVSAQANHDIYKQLGILDVFNQAQPFTGGQPFLKMDDFARARMHWYGEERYEELTDEFRKAYYREAEPEVTQYLHFLENAYQGWVDRGWTTRINSRACIRKYLHTVEDLYRHKELLDRALAATKTQLVYDRVNELTLFYKFTLVICFPLEIPREEALAIIADLRELAAKNEMDMFLRRTGSVEQWLQDAENIVLGKVKEEDRECKLKGPQDGPF